MKKLLILLLLLVVLFACTAKPNNSALTGSGTSTSGQTAFGQKQTAVPYEDTPSYSRVQQDIDAYFRMFYANNQNYKWRQVEVNSNGVYVIGYFDGDLLVKMESAAGESTFYTAIYYFINEDLTYVIGETSGLSSPDEYKEYFIINKKTWQYNNETGSFIGSPDTDYPLSSFEQYKYDLLGDKSQSYVKNTFTFPTENNLFTQFNEANHAYFRKFFAGDSYNREYFQVDLPGYSTKQNVYTLSSGSELRGLTVICSNETSYTYYDYYLIDDVRIYVVVSYQKFDKGTDVADLNAYTKNYESEYFIVNGKVMVYDAQKKDLTESSKNINILTQFNTVKGKIGK